MTSTPRLRSAYPSTPARNPDEAPDGVASASPLPGTSAGGDTGTDSDAPLIPFSILDAPTQRLYVSAFYLGLTAWRLYDYSRLVASESDSLWLFMKWVAIDGVFLYGLPGLKVPWLEWSNSTVTVLFLLHAILNGMLMFRIAVGFPISWLSVQLSDKG
jgi:nucleoporin POM152